MQIQLKATDVFKAAIMLEERASRFYADAAANFSGRAQKLLTQLSEMESGHARQFSGILAEIADKPTEPTGGGDPETDDFLQAMTSDRIITGECRVVAGDTYDIILEKAMLIEKNSVFFYTTVKDIMQGKMAAGAVERLIQEEVGHFKMLNDALKEWRWEK